AAAPAPTENTDQRAGRTRLKGFNVVNATEDGAMSVVKVPSGSIQVFFDGERFNLRGKRVRVSGIDEDGRLVLVGTDYFIDQTREERPKRTIAKPAPRPAERKVEPVAMPSEEPVSSPVSVVTPNGNIVISPKPAPGWSLNAAMSQ